MKVATIMLLCAFPAALGLRVQRDAEGDPDSLVKFAVESMDMPSNCKSLSNLTDCKHAKGNDSCADFDSLTFSLRDFDYGQEFYNVCKQHKRVGFHKTRKGKKAKPMIFVNVHKGAGTLLCNEARLRESVPEPEVNCGAEFDSVKLIGQGKKVSCDERKQVFIDNNKTFGMIEREVNEDDLCFEDFQYGIALRDPLALAESMTNFANYGKDFGSKLHHDSWQQNLQCLTGAPDDCKKLKSSVTGLYHFYDNYLVRTLGGNEVFQKAPGMVTKEDVKKVIDRLEKFRVVQIMNSGSDFAAFEKVMNWPITSKRQETEFSPRPHKHKMDDAAREKVKARLWADYEVYNHFQNRPALPFALKKKQDMHQA